MVPNVKLDYLRCPICRLPSEQQCDGSSKQVDCVRCNVFRITKEAELMLQATGLNERQRTNISSYLSESQVLEVDSNQVPFLTHLSAPPVFGRATRLLRSFARRHPNVGERIHEAGSWSLDGQVLGRVLAGSESRVSGENAERIAPLCQMLSATWSANAQELHYLILKCLQNEAGFVEVDGVFNVWITPKAWQFLESGGQSPSNIGFAAMWFDDEVIEAWEGAIYPAIRDAGYEPLRIDQKQHNGKIDDEIIASIRSSRFIVADFTGQRGGVYFEAGLAFGLGKQVIWTVREDHVSQLHFDTRQFNHIVWRSDDLAAFQRALHFRIESTLGKGPLSPTEKRGH